MVQSSSQVSGQVLGQGLPDVTGLVVGILGGTGDQGRGLARRFARSGQPVIIGSRSAERAASTAAEITAEVTGEVTGEVTDEMIAGTAVSGTTNEECAGSADIVIVAVPWDGHRTTLTGLAGELAGKIVVDCVNPLGFDAQGAYPLVAEEGSAAQQAAAVLPGSRVVAAFHHMSAVHLNDPSVHSVDTDVLVLGDDREATDVVRALAGRIPGVRGVYAGRLRNAHQVEAFTANLISVNRRYKVHAGLRVTDV